MPDNSNDPAVKTWKIAQNQDIHEDPLLDCLIILTKTYGRNISKASLCAGLPLVQNRLTVELFSRAAHRADLSSRTLEKSLDEIGSIQLPAIMLLHDRQACILVEKNSTLNQYRILVPQSGSGEKIVSREELEKGQAVPYTSY